MPEIVRLVRIKAEKLFGIFTHDIKLNSTEQITIIHAPNGYGKTVLLKLIDDFYARRYRNILNIPFSVITFTFSDSSKILIKQLNVTVRNKIEESTGIRQRTLTFQCRKTKSKNHTWTYDPETLPEERLRPSLIERFLPHLDRVGPRSWYDTFRQETLSLYEIIDQYNTDLPDEFTRYKAPDWLISITKGTQCRFIETQRLLEILAPEERSHIHASRTGTPRTTPVVDADAKDLATRIQHQVSEYASVAQELDQTFPQRVISTTHTPLSEEDLRSEITSLDGRRKQLMEAGVFDQKDYPVALSETPIEDRIRNVLSVYVNDTKKKLGMFNDIYEKISAFTEIINSRFYNKTITIDKESGITVQTSDGANLPLNALSSGEQHELVLMYEILFEMKLGSLLLIDEPELSLHVAWQKRFIPDLLRIIQLIDLDVIVATHSPQIINDRWDLTVELTTPV